MVRSSGLPTGRALGGMTRIISARASTVMVGRVSRTQTDLDDTVETVDEHAESMWLFDPMEGISEEIAGERITGSLGALIVDNGVNVQHSDRITYGGVEYEVDTVVGHPNDSDADGTANDETDFFVVSFTRRQ